MQLWDCIVQFINRTLHRGGGVLSHICHFTELKAVASVELLNIYIIITFIIIDHCSVGEMCVEQTCDRTR